MNIQNIAKIKLKINSKCPLNSWTMAKHQNSNYVPNAKYNVGIVCSKASGVIALDLDFYSKTLKNGTVSTYDPQKCAFVAKFGGNYI